MEAFYEGRQATGRSSVSRRNKVNKDNYVQRGRLTPDEMARERINQAQISGGAKGKENVKGRVPAGGSGPGSSRPRSGRAERG